MSAAYRVLLSPSAIADLEEISAFIGSEDPALAQSFLIGIRRKCAAVAVRPAIYRVRPELAQSIRGAKLGRYLIFFRLIEADGIVRIERILHGARDMKRLFDA